MHNKIRYIRGSQSFQMDFPVGKRLRQKPSDYPHIPASGAWNETAFPQQEFFKIGGPEVATTGGTGPRGSGHMMQQKSQSLPISAMIPDAFSSITEERGDMPFI
jgi:hypothetical protein